MMNETEKKTWRRCERIIKNKKNSMQLSNEWTKIPKKKKKISYQVHG